MLLLRGAHSVDRVVSCSGAAARAAARSKRRRAASRRCFGAGAAAALLVAAGACRLRGRSRFLRRRRPRRSPATRPSASRPRRPRPMSPAARRRSSTRAATFRASGGRCFIRSELDELDRRGPAGQSEPAGGAGDAVAGARRISTPRPASCCRIVDANARPTRQQFSPATFGGSGRADHFQSVPGDRERLLCARRVRRQAAADRGERRAGRVSALRARGDLSDADRERRDGGDPGSLAARPDRGDARHHQGRKPISSTSCSISSSSARPPAPTC